MMTIEYTETARQRIENYLTAVRERLKASQSVDAQEVIEGLRGHIERELSGSPSPVSETDARQVLERLGPPEQVAGEEDMAWWQEVLLRLRTGPEDWRLAYLSFAVLIVGTALLGPFGILGSFLLSRASLSVAREPEPPAKKWLIYPPLILVYVSVLAVALLVPAVTLGEAFGEFVGTPGSALYNDPLFDHDGFGTFMAMTAVGGLCFSACGSILWLAGRLKPAWVRLLFEPFAEQWTGRWAARLVFYAWAASIVIALVTAWLWIRT